ncbi:hypothetical protein [Haloactinomyces albus]|uniref:Uncharacterized protein n=1 Tax=Haloactinomyces albus TaxID=1352928 RepID=A0AAE4CPB3_9ACTN|nr:hypothetical protein [Haloactinomyces albus]MDR7302937.1 hypothetical protein [Haloactinomyces albus]
MAAINDYRAGGFLFSSVADGTDEKERDSSRWAHEIVPAVRAATSTG